MASGRNRTTRLAAAAVAVTALAAGGLTGCQQQHARSTRGSSATAQVPSVQPAPPPNPPTGTPSETPSAAVTPTDAATGRSPTPDPSTPGTYVPPQRPARGLPPVISRIPTKDKVVFITIDDGWQKDRDFIQLVKDQKIPITAFLMNDAAKRDYGYFRRLQQAGALIENHTMTHPLMTRLSYARQKSQICRTGDIYAKQYGTRPTLFRAPYGAANSTTRRAARDCGIAAIFFWRETSEHGNLVYQVPGGLHPGDIILVHFEPHMARDFRTLLHRIRKQGYRPAAFEDYLPARYFRQAR